ncbi:MAG: hypothetical protein JWM41_869 [Gemmatimonadetes bacterium]|nr:hypothetical protein [Gemmatimonadota bacterium]
MHIIGLEAQNVKKLRAVTIVPTGSVVQITGPNGSGKSSVLDALFWALAGTKHVTSKPVRNGKQSAVIKLNLGEIRVTRKFTAEGSTSVIVEAQSGARFPSPQRLLDDLLGELTFDPLAFSRAKPKDQLETLRGVVKLDVDIDALDGLNARDFELRTQWGHRIKSFRERAETVRAGLDDSIPAELIDVSALLTQMQDAGKHNADLATEKLDRVRRSTERASALEVAAKCREEAARLVAKAEKLEGTAADILEQLTNAPDLGEPIDVTALRQQIDEATKENAVREYQARQRAALVDAERELADAEEKVGALTAAMNTRKAQKADAIAAANMPVSGLSFGDGEVLFNGVPFEQASSAEQIKVSCALAMAANPKLKIVLIKDGSLLDEASLLTVAQMAEEKGYQVWIEKVATDGKVGVLLEDGGVIAVDGVPVEQADEIEEPAGV